jgi:microcin C transport system permease protein
MTPITLKRVKRFKRIKRGYWSFRIVVTLFVVSWFLELLVSGKALAIYYNGNLAFPAFAEWSNKALFFTDIPSFNKRNDFGQLGESAVDYRRFDAVAEDPSLLAKEIAERKAALATDRAGLKAPGPDAKGYEKRAFEREKEKLKRHEADIAELEANLKVFESGSAWCIMPVYPYGPSDLRHELEKQPPNAPSIAQGIPLGTDVSGRDIVPLLLYGFRISLAFALMVAVCGYAFGVIVGGIQGYYGGWTDIGTQRFVEIWGSIPFLFTIMIIASIVTPTFVLLAILMIVLRSWLGITYYVRGEFYREKSKDYVQAAIGAGVSDWKIIVKHILPNSLVPVVTFAPFGIVAYIGSLVSLDYLGFGLPPGTPSWGALLRQGLENVKFYPHLTIIPVVALAVTLFMVVMIGEAVREAFDPKVFSRLR